MNIDTSCIRLTVGERNCVHVDISQAQSGMCTTMRIMPGNGQTYDGGRAWLARREGDRNPYILLAPDSRWKTDFETDGFFDLVEIALSEAQA